MVYLKQAAFYLLREPKLFPNEQGLTVAFGVDTLIHVPAGTKMVQTEEQEAEFELAMVLEPPESDEPPFVDPHAHLRYLFPEEFLLQVGNVTMRVGYTDFFGTSPRALSEQCLGGYSKETIDAGLWRFERTGLQPYDLVLRRIGATQSIQLTEKNSGIWLWPATQGALFSGGLVTYREGRFWPVREEKGFLLDDQ